jgi:hypothetical protein
VGPSSLEGEGVMSFIEHWRDILSFIVVGGGIGWFFYFLRNEHRTAHRPLSEKPALFLEFTGKQMFVHRRRSKLLRFSREESDTLPPAEPPTTAPVMERLRENLVLLKVLYLTTARDCGRALRVYSTRGRIRMVSSGRHIAAAAVRVVSGIRGRLAVIARARWAGHRPNRRSRRRSGRASTTVQHAISDFRWHLDIESYRLTRAVQMQWQNCKAMTGRLMDVLSAQAQSAIIRVRKLWNDLAGRQGIPSWWRKVESAVAQHQQHVMARYWGLQRAARGHIRGLREADMPERENGARPVRATSAADPIVIGLTSSGTLKLRNRLEDEGVSGYAQAINETTKGSRADNKVSVRFVGTAPRHLRESTENKQPERMVNP